MRFHPDKLEGGSTPADDEHWLRITTAYSVLKVGSWVVSTLGSGVKDRMQRRGLSSWRSCTTSKREAAAVATAWTPHRLLVGQVREAAVGRAVPGVPAHQCLGEAVAGKRGSHDKPHAWQLVLLGTFAFTVSFQWWGCDGCERPADALPVKVLLALVPPAHADSGPGLAALHSSSC